MKQTINYNLPQFEGSDFFNKEDLNDAFNKIDSAISDLQETINVSGNSDVVFAQEIIAARKGKEKLVDKINEIDKNISDFSKFNIKEKYKLKGDGTENITQLINNLLIEKPFIDIVIDDGTYIIDSIVTKFNNQTFIGNATLKGTKNNTMFVFNNDNCSISYLNIDTNNCNYGVEIKKGIKDTSIYNCYFKGKCGHYVIDSGENTHIHLNKTDNLNYSVVIPFVFANSKNFKFTGNDLNNSTGFNVQARFCEDGVISNNTFINEVYEDKLIATQGQQIFNFTLPKTYERIGVNVNDLGKNIGVSVSKTDLSVTASFTNGLNIGDVVKLIGFNSLECININSNCYGITINNNIINGTGDSGIVICADYHNGVLNPSGVDNTDFPRDILISNNNIKNCAYSGIAETHSIYESIIELNNIKNCGLVCDNDYSSGIFASGYNKTISNNLLENCQKGIYVNSYGFVSMQGKNEITLFGNKFKNVITDYYLLGANSTTRATGIEIIKNKFEYPKINLDSIWANDMPAEDNYYGYGKSGLSWTKITDTAIGFGVMARINKASYGEVKIKDTDFFYNTILELSFSAKSSLEISKAQLEFYYCYTGGGTIPVVVDIVSTTDRFTRNTFKINIPKKIEKLYSTGLVFRIKGLEDYVYVKDFSIKATPINN